MSQPQQESMPPASFAPTGEKARELSQLAQVMTAGVAGLRRWQRAREQRDRDGQRAASREDFAAQEALKRADPGASRDDVPRPMDQTEMHRVLGMMNSAPQQQPERSARKHHLGALGEDAWAVVGAASDLGPNTSLSAKVDTERQADALVGMIEDPQTPAAQLQQWVTTSEPLQRDDRVQQQHQRWRARPDEGREMITQAVDGLDLHDPTSEAVGQHLWGMDPQVDAALQERIGAAQEATRQQNETEAAVRSWPGATNTPDPVRTAPATDQRQNGPAEPAARPPEVAAASQVEQVQQGRHAQEASSSSDARVAGEAAASVAGNSPDLAATRAAGEARGTSEPDPAQPDPASEAASETDAERAAAPPPEMIDNEVLMQRYPRPSPWSNQGVFAAEGGVLEGPALADYVRTNVAGWNPQEEGHCHAAARLWSARDGSGEAALDDETRGLLEQQFPGLQQAMTLQETSPHQQAQAAAEQASSQQGYAMAKTGAGASSQHMASSEEGQQGEGQQVQQGPATQVSPQTTTSSRQQQAQRR